MKPETTKARLLQTLHEGSAYSDEVESLVQIIGLDRFELLRTAVRWAPAALVESVLARVQGFCAYHRGRS